MPVNQKKNQKTVFLRQSLIDWLITQGEGDLSSGIEAVAKKLGFTEKEKTDNKQGTADRRPRRTNQQPPICATELNQTV